MKRNLIFFAMSSIVISSMLSGLTASTAQALQPAAQPQVAQPVPIWRRANISGFGDPHNMGSFALEI